MIRKPFRADYTYTIEGNVIAIVDLDGTGHPKALRTTSKRLGPAIRLENIRAERGDLVGIAVIYRDSMGLWDGVRLKDGSAYFYSLNESDQQQAQARLLHSVEH